MKKTREKYTSKVWIDVNKKLAPTVEAIFEEIYNDPERFPVKSICGYRPTDPFINHPSGTAIDINADENYYIKGDVKTGKFWLPGENPYSMPINGSVVRAFKKYGWDWGGNWRNLKDYMHFSYLGG